MEIKISSIKLMTIKAGYYELYHISRPSLLRVGQSKMFFYFKQLRWCFSFRGRCDIAVVKTETLSLFSALNSHYICFAGYHYPE